MDTNLDLVRDARSFYNDSERGTPVLIVAHHVLPGYDPFFLGGFLMWGADYILQ